MNANTRGPKRTFRLKGVKVSVFENPSQNGVLHKITVQRIYREGTEWKTTTGLSRDDIPVARLLMARAWEFILDAEAHPEHNE